MAYNCDILVFQISCDDLSNVWFRIIVKDFDVFGTGLRSFSIYSENRRLKEIIDVVFSTYGIPFIETVNQDWTCRFEKNCKHRFWFKLVPTHDYFGRFTFRQPGRVRLFTPNCPIINPRLITSYNIK